MTSAPIQAQTPTQASADRASGSGSGARKFLGRIFKKKNASMEGSSSASSSPRNSLQPLPALQLSPTTSESTPRSGGGKRSSLLLAASQITSHLPSPSSSSFHHHTQPTPGHSQTPSNANDQGPSAPTVLGISPSVSSPVFPPRGRHPKSYVWVVRRWLKNADEGLLGRINDKLNNGAGMAGPVEVRFEWTRAQPKKRGRGKSETGLESRRTSRALSSNTPSKSSLKQGQNRHSVTSPTLSPDVTQQLHSPRSRERFERSADSRRSSGSPNPPSSSHHTTSEEGERERQQSPMRRSRTMNSEYGQEDDGEESDPEDSETPWTCTLVLRSLVTSTSQSHPAQPQSPSYPQSQPQPKSRRPTSSYSIANNPTHLQSPTTPASSSQAHQAQTQVQDTRIRVGAIVPAPHHPKVVSLLKIPFPLPDIEVDKAFVRKRVVTPAGVARPPTSHSSSKDSGVSGKFGGNGNGGGAPGLVLTAEEIKDIVACTGLWVVVRESFGGVGKERRKGDGWRIRG